MTATSGDLDPIGLLDDPAAHLGTGDAALRRLAVAACARLLDVRSVRNRIIEMLHSDPSAAVRAEAAEILGGSGASALDDLLAATEDPDARVAEAAATALGEIAVAAAVPRLIELANGHEDRLVNEAAVAALGAIGDVRALPELLRLVAAGPPQVRRRAVVALTVFDGPEVEQALHRAAEDRNPMVREVARLIVGSARDRREDSGPQEGALRSVHR